MAERRRGREASGSAGRREAGGSPGGGSAAAASGSPARTPGVNAFANDGSFMELFKKMEEEKQRREASGTDAENGGKRGPEAGSDGHSSRKPTLNIGSVKNGLPPLTVTCILYVRSALRRCRGRCILCGMRSNFRSPV
ncbi:telomerase RNA component interacting RNase isoform X2 [Mobula hypostoma]|uniref:telomerase RNA component interacting RNase isoform X2 n=1 Tax=Mobula hypostoma TaxID=723540 RepID=UPI002FC3D6DA